MRKMLLGIMMFMFILLLTACDKKEELAPGDYEIKEEEELNIATIVDDDEYYFKDSEREEWESEEDNEEEVVKFLPFSLDTFIENYNLLDSDLVIQDKTLTDNHVYFNLSTDKEYEEKYKVAKADQLDFISIVGTFDYEEDLMESLGINHYHSEPFKNEFNVEKFIDQSVDIFKVTSSFDNAASDALKNYMIEINKKPTPKTKHPVKDGIFEHNSLIYYFNMNENDISFSVMPKSFYDPSLTSKAIQLKKPSITE